MRLHSGNSYLLRRRLGRRQSARAWVTVALTAALALLFETVPTLRHADFLPKATGQTINVPQAGFAFIVNSTADPGTNVSCTQPGGNCTLRAAINAANANPGTNGITFDLPPNSSLIELSSPLANYDATNTLVYQPLLASFAFD